MMGVDFQIPLAGHGQIHHRMLGKKDQHMVEKRDTRLDPGFAGAINIELQRDSSFLRLTFDLGSANRHEAAI